MRAARDALAAQTLFHGAVGRYHWQRGDELGHQRALPGRLQERGEACRADVLDARESRAVLEHEFRRGDALENQTMLHASRGVLAARRLAVELGAERNENLGRQS